MFRNDLLLLACAALAAALASAPPPRSMRASVSALVLWPADPPAADPFTLSGLDPERSTVQR